jgi:hypothetical protein
VQREVENSSLSPSYLADGEAGTRSEGHGTGGATGCGEGAKKILFLRHHCGRNSGDRLERRSTSSKSIENHEWRELFEWDEESEHRGVADLSGRRDKGMGTKEWGQRNGDKGMGTKE